ncbi:acyltransferase-domain-containing protein [Auriculariales sp. MPI-PUGE-AT-0066]|nr:acyltransferase-domain-containing protein [Auriculariales sp. MPI-PUGE-AT-0066]
MCASLLSRFTVAAVGLGSKAFLKLGCASVTVEGLPILLDALRDPHRTDRGILTVANHISVMDDPTTWGALPASYYLSSRTTRWTLGAADIMFTNPITSSFFRYGQVIKTFRGQGIWQDALNVAIDKIDSGEWIHVFPEGKVNQTLSNQAQLLRFKWGIGRLLMDAQQTPLIIPMWLTGRSCGSGVPSTALTKVTPPGFDQALPEDRGFPRFLPRLRKNISITFGDPFSATNQVEATLAKWRDLVPQKLRETRDGEQQTAMRVKLTRLVQEEVEKLGYSVISQMSRPSIGKHVQ